MKKLFVVIPAKQGVAELRKMVIPSLPDGRQGANRRRGILELIDIIRIKISLFVRNDSKNVLLQQPGRRESSIFKIFWMPAYNMRA